MIHPSVSRVALASSLEKGAVVPCMAYGNFTGKEIFRGKGFEPTLVCNQPETSSEGCRLFKANRFSCIKAKAQVCRLRFLIFFLHPPRSATGRRPCPNAPLLCFCQVKPQLRRSENRSQVRAFPDCSAHPGQIGRSSPPKPRSAPSDKVDLISFAANLGIFPAGDLVRGMQIGRFSPEAVLSYCERGKSFKANRFSCIKKKTPDHFQRFHFFYSFNLFGLRSAPSDEVD